MTDTATPAADPTTPAAPTPATVTTAAPSSPVPGYKTTEAWFTLITNILGFIPSSGLVANAPLASRVAGIVAAAFATIVYMVQRTSLKQAHLALTLTQATPANGKKLLAAGTAASVAAVLIAIGCAGPQTAATVGKDITVGGSSFLKCETVNVNQIVTDPVGRALPLIKVAADDLVAGNYVQAIADLVGQLGANIVGCAVLAVEDVVTAGKTSGAAALSPLELRAQEMISKYGWRTPPAATTETKPGPLSINGKTDPGSPLIWLSPGQDDLAFNPWAPRTNGTPL